MPVNCNLQQKIYQLLIIFSMILFSNYISKEIQLILNFKLKLLKKHIQLSVFYF